MSTNLSCTVNSSGISAPVLSDIITYLQQAYLGIFGSDAYLAPDSQDGQLLAIFAAAINDSNAATIQCYNSYSPSFAQGAGLSSQVKINGLRRLVASNSTVDVQITGTPGTTLNNCLVADNQGNQWSIANGTVIDVSGSNIVLATAVNPGAIPAALGTINTILTPTLGWQTVYNIADATLGNPVETDNILRVRQSVSTEYPALSVPQAVAAAVSNVSGVIQSMLYENPTGTVDSNGVPAHSIAVVTSGGDPVAIANAIANRKSPGCGTYGTTTETVMVEGYPTNINFFIASNQVLTTTITLQAFNGYTYNDGNTAAQNLVNYIKTLTIGQDVYLTNAYAAIIGTTYHVVSIAFGLNGSDQTIQDVIIPFNGLASLQLNAVTVQVQ